MDAADDIAARVTRYFARQIAWLEAQRDELRALPEDLTGAALETLVSRQAQRERESVEFAREQQGLLREWHAANVDATVRAEVQALARQAQVRADELCRAYDAAAERTRGTANAPKESLDTLRRGRRMMDAYRPADPGAADFLNRRA